MTVVSLAAICSLALAIGATSAAFTGSRLAAVVCGAGVGLGAGLLFGRVLERLLFRVATTDALALGVPLAVLAAATAVAALPPALRAVRIDPANTLRAD